MKHARSLVLTTSSLLVAVACGSGNVPIGFTDSGVDATPDVAAPDVVTYDAPTFSDVTVEASPAFFVLLTESPPGPTEPINTWGGVLQFNLPNDFLDASAGTGIPNVPGNDLHDPDSLAFRHKTAELFVGNRHGNNAGDGVYGSISRFLYVASNETFIPNGHIAGSGDGGLFAVAQIYFDPTEAHLFAANYGGGTVTRYHFSGPDPVFDGDIIKNVSPLGLVIAPSGKTLFLTEVFKGTIRRFDPVTGTEILPSISTPGSRLAWMTVANAGKTLFVCDFDGAIYVYTIGIGDVLTLQQTIPDDYPISLTLSPDEQELFVAEHDFVNGTTKEVHRFKQVGEGGTWTLDGKIPVSSGLGATLTFLASAVPIP